VFNKEADMARTTQPDIRKRAYSITEAQEALSFGRTKLRTLIQSGELPARKHGGRVVVLAEDLEAFLQGLELAR
jgi:excisionase family DNA binding protein